MEAWLTATRALHFSAVIVLFGQFAYAYLIAPPGRLPARFGAVAAASLAVAAVTALAWLALEAANMSGLALGEALRSGTAGIVLTQTLFGHVWMVRAALAVVLGASLVAMHIAPSDVARASGGICALLLLAALACAGHAAGEAGVHRLARAGNDALHLVAAGAWLGALVPLTVLLRRAGREPAHEDLVLASGAVQRFSALGLACVAVLVLTGIVNACYAVCDVAALFTSRYGLELAAKVSIFAIIVAIAAVNRMSLAPRLATIEPGSGAKVSHALARNALLEIVLGFAIVAIVGNLGITMPPMPGH